MRDDTTRKIKYLTLFFTFNKLLPNISRTLSINILHNRQIFRSLGMESQKLQFSWNFEKKKETERFLLHFRNDWRTTHYTDERGKSFTNFINIMHKCHININAASKWMRNIKSIIVTTKSLW